MTVQVDRQACAAFLIRHRRQHNAIHQFADDIRRLGMRVFIAQRLTECGNLVTVIVRHVGVNQNRIIRRVLDPRLCLRLAVLKVRHLVLDAAGRHPVHKSLHQPVEFALDLRERGPVNLMLRIALAAQPVHVPRVFLTEHVAQHRVHQMILQAFQHSDFESIAADSVAVVADSFVARVRAADALGIEDDEPAPAAAAAHQTGEQIMRPALVPVAL